MIKNLLPIACKRGEFMCFVVESRYHYEGFVRPSLKELPQLGLEDFLERGLLKVSPEFTVIEIRNVLRLYFKPWTIGKILESYVRFLEEENPNLRIPDYEKTAKIKTNLDFRLPDTYVCRSISVALWYGVSTLSFLRYFRSKKEISVLANQEPPINEELIIFVFKEIEKEFLLLIEAYEEVKKQGT